MALPVSGTMGLDMINTELGKGSSASVSLNDSDVRSLAANGIIHPDTYSFKALEDYSTYVCLGHIRHPFSVDKCLGHGFIHKHHPIETEFTCEYDGTHQHLIILHGKVMDKESGLVLNSGERTPIDLDKPRFFITQENTHIAMV